MAKIEITIGKVILIVDCLNTPTSRLILEALPFHSTAQIWGKEVYFLTPIHTEKESDAKEIIEQGEIAFWVEGNCIAIGYGPTPVSKENEIRLAAKTNIWAHSKDDLSSLSKVKPGDPIRLIQVD